MTIPNTDERAAELLHWAADRLTHVYAENPRLDYVLAMHREAERLAPGLKVEDINYRERAAGGTIISESMDPASVMTALDPLVERVVCTLAADRLDKWSEVLDGRTEARTWLVGMTSFHFGGEIDRNAVQAYIDGQVDRIRELDVADAAGRKTWAHSRMPQPRRACGVPERAPVEDVVAMAVVEGTAAEFLVSMPDKAQGNHDDANKPPRLEMRIDTSDPENFRVIDMTRTQLLPDGSLSIVTTPADANDTEDWVTLDMKGPTAAPMIPGSSIRPTVTLTKSELAKLLEQAFAEGVGCDERYEGGADNQLACVTDILDEVLFEGPTRLEDMTPELADPVIADDADWYPTFEEMGAYLTQIAGPGATVSAVKDKEDWRVDFPFNLSIEICWVERQTVTRSELKEILRRQVEIYFQGEGKACAAPPTEVEDLDRVLMFAEMDRFIADLAVEEGGTVSRAVSGNVSSHQYYWDIKFPDGDVRFYHGGGRSSTKREILKSLETAKSCWTGRQFTRRSGLGAR
ncbi:hypothetical protein [Aureimonas glaciei]|uniref:Uncharacterized protein n=1 Tax=Aureimonas glaciei TaxID=1776957 RepID=A0A916Y567_9HYPH|nr:hypothetical protein [Aureimonas glaciei]GGD31329.1 hypothetical protein GCM10011335_37940 [Aureimonas glaciei]